jgi:purine-binding chemotaxis protein CheW
MQTQDARETRATQYLAFRLASDQYAISILRVREILEFGSITRVPSAPPWVRGVFNLRGAVVPVVDLAVKLGLPASIATRRSCVVVVETTRGEGTTTMALMIDEVSSVLELRPSDLEAVPDFGAPVRSDHLEGMAASASGFVLLLDIDGVLSPDDRIDLARSADAASAGAQG